MVEESDRVRLGYIIDLPDPHAKDFGNWVHVKDAKTRDEARVWLRENVCPHASDEQCDLFITVLEE